VTASAPNGAAPPFSLGGARATAARYLLVRLPHALGPAFPYGTLAVNVISSLLLGIIMQAGLDTTLLSPTARRSGPGVMSGFTTY
jgi:CrcB protein